ncbi:MAG: phosphoadenosine phosphosulfate reductase family protein [Mangrovibacterium sp.]
MSLKAYAYSHRHWVSAWSGGKDSTTVTTLLIYLILSGQIPQPETFTVMYADTRQELLPLSISAYRIIDQIRALNLPWLKVKIVMSDIDHRFLVYMLGRGVPPPSNTMRWCTGMVKVMPMQKAIQQEFDTLGEKVLTITGVRMGESAIRDGRLTMACSKNDAECGQGWYMNTLDNKITATIAPIIHWRVCNVWDWLQIFAPQEKYGGWDTQMLAQAYGGDKANEVNARTGCNGCPLVDHDTALDAIMRLYPDEWGYLKPMKEIRPIFREMRKFKYRIRKHGETNKDGQLSKNSFRVGPLTMEARKKFTQEILDIQNEVNDVAIKQGRPVIDILNQEEIDRILWHWDNNIWPQRWDGSEPGALEKFNQVFSDGCVLQSLF